MATSVAARARQDVTATHSAMLKDVSSLTTMYCAGWSTCTPVAAGAASGRDGDREGVRVGEDDGAADLVIDKVTDSVGLVNADGVTESETTLGEGDADAGLRDGEGLASGVRVLD